MKQAVKICCLFAGLLPLGGCLQEEPKLNLGVAVPAKFELAGKAASAPVDENWPHLFGSRELDSLSAAALRDNFDIATSVAKIAQAQAQAGISAASLYPQLSGSGDASRTLTPGTIHSKAPPFKATVTNNFDLGLDASYMVDFWGRYRAGAEAAQDNVTASQFDLETTKLSTISAVANAYFTILATQDRLKLARENLKITERVLDAIRARIAVGTATALDQLSQEALVANSRAAIPPLDISYAQAKNTLAVLMGRPPESIHLNGGGLDLLREPRIAAGIPAQLLTRRPDIAAAEARLAAQKANVAAARAALLPSVQLTGKTGLQSLVLKNLFRPEATLASLAAGVTEPIFDGGALQGQVDEARALQEQLLIAYRKSIISAFSDVENALSSIEAQKRHEQLQVLAVAASRRAYDINEKILHEGSIDVTSVLNAEKSLFDAEDTLVQVRLAKFSAYVSLIEALGGGWSVPQIEAQL